ncbi:MAG: HAMP domain-containing sensor histidine kinase [Ornithinimicrobium sp.]
MSVVGSLKQTAYQRLHALSLTKRLVAVVVLMVLVAYLVTTSVTIMLLRGYLTDRMDTDLRQYIEPLGQQAYQQAVQGEPFATRATPPNNYYVVLTLRAEDSTPFPFVTEATNGDHPDLGRVEYDDPSLARGPFTASSEGGGTNWRVLTARLSNGEGTVAIAAPMTPIENTVSQLWVLTFLVGAVTLAAVSVLGWLAVRRAFRPLSRIEDTASAIAAGDLGRRVPTPGANDEVASLSHSLNIMLADIEQAFAVRKASEARMRQFVADASHELRTPLATVQGYAELYRVGGVTDPDDVATAMRRIEDEAHRMTRMVESLLLLTRWDSIGQMERQPVDLTVLCSDVVQDAVVRAPERVVTLAPLGAQRVHPVTPGDDGALRQVLTNLVANAMAHTPTGTAIEVVLGVVDDRCVVEVRDHGEGIDSAAADRVFERFYRADAGRSRERGGTGLGLAIVATIVARHSGTVRHHPTPGGGATFRVDLPLVTDGSAAQVDADGDTNTDTDTDVEGGKPATKPATKWPLAQVMSVRSFRR